MMSHDNVVFTATQNTIFFKWNPGQESVLSYLPQCHMAGIMMDQVRLYNSKLDMIY